MTLAHSLLNDAFGRVHDDLPDVVEGLHHDGLRWQPDPGANSIGWLVWHLTNGGERPGGKKPK